MSFASAEAQELFPDVMPMAQQLRAIILYGAPFSFTIMTILFTHEMGHYLTARYYRVKATLPYFIPFPFSLIGTLGAFIMIRSPFPNRRALIDIGLAGPFAGFIVTIPALFIGIAQSRLGPPLAEGEGLTLGEPILFRLVSYLLWPDAPDDQVLFISPVGFAAWFGLLATAINLMPIGQLDGGHASYALFRGGAHRISRVAFFLLFPMAYFGPTWLVWAMLAFLLGIRRPHPPTLSDHTPLPRSRKWMGALGYLTFILCFTPQPIEFSWTQVFGG
ncbi:MAG TPA: site-2 protease family protein [Vicinamibacteria bacterium]|jgi:membrane-associated protease RseP (regulator of RpoE activity)